MQLSFGLIGMAAVLAVGLIEWGKGVVKNAPSWVWSIVLPVAAFVAALAGRGIAEQPLVWFWLLTWAVAQIGYALIIQSVRAAIGKK